MSDCVVERVRGRLWLRARDGGRGVCLDIDDVRRRLKQGRQLALAKACGVRADWKVLDAMAGLGLDGLTLAALGCRVTMVERDASLAAMLEDAVVEARRRLPLANVETIAADVRCLAIEPRQFDAIYLDPMFPLRNDGALPGKAAQLLARHVGTSEDDLDALLLRCRALAANRVVLKRRRHDAVVAPPDWQISGRSVRFDVYRSTAD
jgi:16S rRNA (guanine1516-N2)-methyltransferase